MYLQCSECRICNKRHNLVKIIDLQVNIYSYKNILES
jgi:hypothetical protein